MPRSDSLTQSGRRARRVLTGAALTVVTVLATVAATGGAEAATAQASPAGTGGLHLSAAPGVLRPAVTAVTVTHTSTTAPYTTITCTLTAQPPLRYYGGAYPGGGVEAIASVQCTNVVNAIAVEVLLLKNNALVAQSPVRYSYSTTQGGQTTDTPHGAGTYITAAETGITFPDGTYIVSSEADSAPLYISS